MIHFDLNVCYEEEKKGCENNWANETVHIGCLTGLPVPTYIHTFDCIKWLRNFTVETFHFQTKISKLYKISSASAEENTALKAL